MNARQPSTGPGMDRSRNIDDLHHLRLMSLLDEMVQDKGVMRAARELGVNYRTLASALEGGQLSRRMRGALENALLEGGGSPAREQRQRNDDLAGRLEIVEGRVDEMGKEMGEGLPAVQGEVQALRNEHGRDLHRVESRLAQVERGRGRRQRFRRVSYGSAGQACNNSFTAPAGFPRTCDPGTRR